MKSITERPVMTRQECERHLKHTIQCLLESGASREAVTKAIGGLYIDLKFDDFRAKPKYTAD